VGRAPRRRRLTTTKVPLPAGPAPRHDARVRSIAATILLMLALAAPALADGVRASGTCGSGATAEFRLDAHDDEIRVELRVRSRRAREHWRVALVHERRVVWRGEVRTRSNRSFRVRRSVADFEGADEVSARASGPRGNTCQATATLPG
jgi:hypothetical protein